MKKLLIMPVLLFLVCIIAGLYGCLHDQISYSVSPEYFTKFKFDQFNIPEHLHNRLGVAVVGWRATWWMGIVIGVFVIPSGLIMKGWKNYFVQTLLSFAVVAVTALVVGLGALVVSFFTIHEGSLPPWSYPDALTDVVSYARVGTMHNFGYLGGFIGILTGTGYLIVKRIRMNKTRRLRRNSAEPKGQRSRIAVTKVNSTIGR
jgi:hypothetical protein